MGVYELLKEIAFRYSKIKNKGLFFMKINLIKPMVSIEDINITFHNHIKENF